jgi:cyclic pyranopterin phosphate synthase
VAKAKRLSHVDESGRARMVDVSAKDVTTREAVARGRVTMQPETLAQIVDGTVPKGDVLAVARLAGVMAAKRTAELIPLCHPLPIDHVDVTVIPDRDASCVRIESRARVTARTGVEMEALTAAAVAALTLYDMCKSVDRSMVIEDVCLVEKRGGKSGAWVRD